MQLLRQPILAIALALVFAASAHAAVDFLQDGQFRYGMVIGEADEWLAKNESDFIVQYRIDTPSTNEIACIYEETEFYRVRFYQGTCYFIERRAEIDAEALPALFEQFTAEYGESPEVTQSRDQRLWYGHWILRDRDVELTAYDRFEGKYILTYQEFDPLLLGEALRVQEQEVMNSSVQIDPITGKPILVESEESGGEQGEAADGDEEGQEAESQSEGEEDGDQDEDSSEDEEEDDDWDYYYN